MSIPEIMSDILEAKAEVLDLHTKRKSVNLRSAMAEFEKAHFAMNQARLFINMELEA